MLLLQINEPIRYRPVKWTKNIADLAEGQRYTRLIGNHPNNPEYGTVEIAVTPLEGSLDGITEVFFLSEGSHTARMLRWEKVTQDHYRIEVAFDTIFSNGLEYSARDFITEGGGLIGLSESDKQALQQIEGQSRLLALLTDAILPERKEPILKLAKPCLLCFPNAGQDTHRPHFGGPAKHPAPDLPATPGGSPLFHLATLRTADLPAASLPDPVAPWLSFYLRITGTENSWPEQPGDFAILPADRLPDPERSADAGDDPATNFDTRLVLDLPGYDHALIHQLRLSDGEAARYEALRDTWQQLVPGEQDTGAFNKILGYPDNVQNCVAYEAERIHHQRDYSAAIYRQATDWQLLLQVSPDCYWFPFFDTFGDGTIYFMIRQEDLERGEWGKCQVVVQGT